MFPDCTFIWLATGHDDVWYAAHALCLHSISSAGNLGAQTDDETIRCPAEQMCDLVSGATASQHLRFPFKGKGKGKGKRSPQLRVVRIPRCN